VSKFYQSPRWSGEYLDCSMPMTFDTYSVCSYNCLYCFSFFQRSVAGASEDYLSRNVKPVSIERIKKMFTEPETTQFKNYIKNRYTVQWGGLSDQFDEYERKYGVTLELMKFFREIDYPLSFSTKATWFLSDPRYLEVIEGAKNWHFKISIISNDEEKSKKMERGVDTPTRRIDAINTLARLGVAGVTLRFRPFIIGMSDPGHQELITSAADAGADSISTEFLCLETRASNKGKKRYEQMSEVVGYDIYERYKHYSSGQGYLRLSRAIKEKYVNEMEDACKKNGLRFYVSDAHFKERCHHGACCGIPEKMKYNKGQFTEALVGARKNKQVSFSDIKVDAENIFGDIEFGRAVGFNAGSSELRSKRKGWTLFDLMRYQWNVPKSANSPYRYFGGIVTPVSKDKNGDIVYEYTDR